MTRIYHYRDPEKDLDYFEIRSQTSDAAENFMNFMVSSSIRYYSMDWPWSMYATDDKALAAEIVLKFGDHILFDGETSLDLSQFFDKNAPVVHDPIADILREEIRKEVDAEILRAIGKKV